MKVELVDITPDAEKKIGYYAGECYNAKRDEQSCIRRARKCMEDGHLSTLRFANAVFHISGISRVCSHQLVRHKHLDYLQQSQRYVNQEEAAIIDPFDFSEQADDIFSESVTKAKQAYRQLIELGVKKEDARFVLPEAIETSMYVVGNLQAWKDFIKLRSDKHAQWEIRQVAKEINNQLHKHCPNIFNWMP